MWHYTRIILSLLFPVCCNPEAVLPVLHIFLLIYLIHRPLPASYYIKGQVGALNQIILNLVTNAIHAIGDKKGRIKLQFGLSVDDDQTVRLVVEDNGCGIPKDLRKHVFEPFFTTKKEGKGTGIGLTVVKRMVEEHGGWIQVQSEEEKGTTFIMNFPRVDDSK